MDIFLLLYSWYREEREREKEVREELNELEQAPFLFFTFFGGALWGAEADLCFSDADTNGANIQQRPKCSIIIDSQPLKDKISQIIPDDRTGSSLSLHIKCEYQIVWWKCIRL